MEAAARTGDVTAHAQYDYSAAAKNDTATLTSLKYMLCYYRNNTICKHSSKSGRHAQIIVTSCFIISCSF